MKLFVRICSIIVAAALVLGVFAIVIYTGVSADSAGILLSSKTVNEGENVSVDVTLSAEGVYGAQFIVNYDNTHLAIQSITTTLDNEDYLFISDKNSTPGSFAVIISAGQEIPTGVIATVSFTAANVNSDTAATLSFGRILLADSTASAIGGVTGGGATVTIKHMSLKTAAANLTLTSDITLNVYVDKKYTELYDYSDLYILFTITGREGTAYPETCEKDENYWQFKFRNINPYEFTQNITYTLYGTRNDALCSSAVKNYSVIQYCANIFAKTGISENEKTLLADMLNYGAAAQTYINMYTDDLCNEDDSVADYIETYQTVETPTINTIASKVYSTVATPTASLTAASLNLGYAVAMQFAFTTTEDLEDIEIRVYDENSVLRKTFTSDDFKENDGLRFVKFSEYGAAFMKKPVLVTVYKDDVAISNTFRYSIESYAYSRVNNTSTKPNAINLKNLCIALMKYGNSAARLSV